MIRALCNHRFIPGNGIIGSGAFFIFQRNSETVEELEISRRRGTIFNTSCPYSYRFVIRVPSKKKKITRIIFENV